MVLKHCPHCGGCSLEAAGCQAAPSPPPPLPPVAPSMMPDVLDDAVPQSPEPAAPPPVPQFDCRDVEHCSKWSEHKRHHCHWKEGVVCDLPPSETSSTMRPYDCQAGLELLDSLWSDDKKAWCCKAQGVGCRLSIVGQGVKPGQAMAFRRRYDSDEPKLQAPRPRASDVPEAVREQNPHRGAVGLAVLGAMFISGMLVMGRVRGRRSELQNPLHRYDRTQSRDIHHDEENSPEEERITDERLPVIE